MRTSKWLIHTWTHGHTDTQTQSTTIPEGQNWPRIIKLYLQSIVLFRGFQSSLGAFFFSLYKTLFLRNYIRLHTTSSYQIDGPAETETIPLLMHWNRLSPIPMSSRWYQYIYMQTATYNKHPQTCFYKHNRYVNHIKITVHSIMSLKYMSPSSFHQFCSLLATCHRDLLTLFYTIAFFPQCMHHKLEYDRYLINMQYVINKF